MSPTHQEIQCLAPRHYLNQYWLIIKGILITVTSWWPGWRLKSPASRLFTQSFIQTQIKENIKATRHWPLCWEFTGDRWIPCTKGQWRGKCFHLMTSSCVVSPWEQTAHCPACRTTLVATRFRVAVICPIIQVPHCIRVFFYFVWFVFINHIFQFYYELCTYCNILDIYLS